jgi:hypothetical protein
MRRLVPLLSITVAISACREDAVDEASACLMSATDVANVLVWWPCAADHRRARLTCDLGPSDEPGELVLTTRFVDGRDPNDSCGQHLSTQCSFEPLTDEFDSIRYVDATFPLNVPDSELPVCLTPDGDETQFGE